MMKLFMKKSKKGITLVESAIAVVLLGFAAAGVLSLLISSGAKIFQISSESSAYAAATQKLDYVISAISNGCNTYAANGDWDISSLPNAENGKWEGATIDVTTEFYDNYETEYTGAEGQELGKYIRGWYLELTYDGVTVTGFAANSEGVFDRS